MNPAWTLLVPALGAVGIALTGRWPNLRETVTLVCATTLAVLIALLWGPVLAGGRPAWTGPEMFPGIHLALEVEPLGLIYATVGAFLWLPNSLYSIGYMRGHHEKQQTRFYICFALALASVMGIAFAGNLVTLFAFYEVLSLSTFPLVTHHQSPNARRAGRTYLGFLMTTSMAFLLAAIVGTYVLTGRVDFDPQGILGGTTVWAQGVLLVLFIAGIGKAGLMPLHFWLPQAMVAPTPVSALLHAVAVVKAGVFIVLKVAVYVFGITTLREHLDADWLVGVAAGTVLLASLVAITQDNLKARLAYSTVSQLAYIVLGAAVATSTSVIGAGFHIAAHALGKITLFFCAGAIYVASGKTKISELDGIGRVMPWTMGAFLIGALSIIGLPPLAGAWSKWNLGLGALEAERPLVLAVLLISSLLNVLYLLPIPIRAFYQGPADTPAGAPAERREAPWPCLVALGLTALGSIALFVYPQPVLDLMAQVVEAAS